ncbi:hypothetical protein AB0H12_30905 [Actinosynnema sp. NPDC023794]
MDTAEQDRLIEAIIGPASEAYYSDRVRSSGAARVRAQAAQSATTVFFGGLVATFTATALAERPLEIRIAGFVAVALWLSAGILYLWAVAAPVRESTDGRHVKSRHELIAHVLKKADNEAKQVDTRQRWANLVVLLAMTATVACFGLFVFGSADRTAHGELVVSSKQVEELKKLCGALEDRIKGLIDKESLGAQFVKVDVVASGCNPVKFTLHVPRGEVIAILLEGSAG